MIFSDKYIDYSSKTKKELYESLFLFLLISNKRIVTIGKHLLKFALKFKLPVTGIIKKTIFHLMGPQVRTF